MIKGYSKRGYEFSFSWIFTVLVGAFIIFLAIYFAVRLVGTEQFTREAREGKTIGILLTPIETQTEEGKVARIILADKTVLFNECSPPVPKTNDFGSQKIGTVVDPPIGERISKLNGTMSTFHNKYIFTSSYGIEGEEEMYVLSKPLWLPFKAADLLIVWSDQEGYCFKNPPSPIETRLRRLDLPGVEISTVCDPSKKEVCFGPTPNTCEITVDTNQNKVMKDNEDLYYLKSLEDDPYAMMYAAIFSDPENYKCQARRILAHASKLVDLHFYKSKQIIFPATGCGQNAGTYLSQLNYTINRALTSSDLSGIKLVNLYTSDQNFERSFLRYGGGNGCEIF